MRRAGRRDLNHAEIRDGPRKCGASVLDLGGVGNDCPDLLVGWKGRNSLLEIKSAKGAESAGQSRFRQTWRGETSTVRTLQEALLAVGVLK